MEGRREAARVGLPPTPHRRRTLRPVELHGAHVALVTPLTEDRDVHRDDVERLVRHAAREGARGVLVAGSTGEGGLLEPDQRVELTGTARAVADDLDTPLTVMAGASGPTVSAVDRDVATLAAAGADAVLVLAPSLYPLSPDELAAFHLDVADRAEVPTLVYHLPQLTGSALTPETVRELAGHPRLVGMKDSSHDDARRLAFVEVTAGADDFAVLTGSASSLAAALQAGAAGSITAIANVRQRTVTALHQAVADGDDDACEERQAELTRTADALKQVAGSTPAVYKAALQLEGMVEQRWCRPPLASLPPQRLDHVRTALVLR